MGTSFNFDTSFALTLLAVVVLSAAILVWHARRTKRLRREEKRQARRVYKDWLAASDMSPLTGAAEQAPAPLPFKLSRDSGAQR